MDWKRLRLSLNSPLPGALHNPIAPVRVGTNPHSSCGLIFSLSNVNGSYLFLFRTLRSPKTGTRQCSNRYTKYPVSPSHGFHFVDVCFVHCVVLLASKLCVCVSMCVFFCVMSHCVLSPHRCTQSLSRKTLIAPPTLSLRTMTFR